MTLLWMDVEELFEGHELAQAHAALASGERGRVIEGLDAIGLHDRDHETDEEDRILALRSAVLGPGATGDEAEVWAARTTRQAAAVCCAPEAAALLRAAVAWAAGEDPPAWAFDLARPGASALERAAVFSVMQLAREDVEHRWRRDG